MHTLWASVCVGVGNTQLFRGTQFPKARNVLQVAGLVEGREEKGGCTGWSWVGVWGREEACGKR